MIEAVELSRMVSSVCHDMYEYVFPGVGCTVHVLLDLWEFSGEGFLLA